MVEPFSLAWSGIVRIGAGSPSSMSTRVHPWSRNDGSFLILAVLTITAAVAAMTLRNLIHCALAVAVTFVGLAATYLQLNAQFVGWAQILVYVGAVAILIVFAVLLTRGGEPSSDFIFSKSWFAGLAVALAVFGLLAWAVAKSFLNTNEVPPALKRPPGRSATP